MSEKKKSLDNKIGDFIVFSVIYVCLMSIPLTLAMIGSKYRDLMDVYMEIGVLMSIFGIFLIVMYIFGCITNFLKR